MLAKYTEEEIIRLATQNPCFGFVRFGKILYPAKKGEFRTSSAAAEMISIFEEHKKETGIDLYDSLQSEEGLPKITEEEYIKITGKKNLSSGSGRTSGFRVTKGGAMRVLHPQEFLWGEIVPEDERPSQIEERRSRFPNIGIENIHYEFGQIWEYWMEGYSRAEISRELNMSTTNGAKKVNMLIEFDKNNKLEEWMKLIELMKWFISDRGIASFKEENDDEIMLFIHSIVDEYIRNPIDNELPNLKEITQAYREVCQIVDEESV